MTNSPAATRLKEKDMSMKNPGLSAARKKAATPNSYVGMLALLFS